MKKKDENNFLGTGWSFPPSFDLASGSVRMVKDELDVEQSLSILMATSIGERILRSDYGCGIHNISFENITTTLLTKIKRIIEMAILKYEPRIDLKGVYFSKTKTLDGVLYIEMEYVIRSTNSRMNFVYPYYIKEGSLIKD